MEHFLMIMGPEVVVPYLLVRLFDQGSGRAVFLRGIEYDEASLLSDAPKLQICC